MNPGWREQYLRYKAYLLNTAAQYRQRRDIRAYLEILLSLATVSIFSIFALRPTLITIAELLKDIESKEKTIATMDTKIENLANAKSLYQSQGRNIALLNSSIPNGASPETLVRQLEGITARYSVNVRSASVGNAPLSGAGNNSDSSNSNNDEFPEGSNVLSFSVNVDGDYQLLADFLEGLENLRRPVKIDRIIFASRDGQEGNTLTLTVTSRTPYIDERPSP